MIALASQNCTQIGITIHYIESKASRDAQSVEVPVVATITQHLHTSASISSTHTRNAFPLSAAHSKGRPSAKSNMIQYQDEAF